MYISRKAVNVIFTVGRLALTVDFNAHFSQGRQCDFHCWSFSFNCWFQCTFLVRTLV